MSGWGLGWFGGGAAAKRKDAPKNAILQLRSQLEMLSKREKHLQSQMDEQDAQARKFVSTNKNAAKAALRKKKVFETNYEQTHGQIMALEREIYAIESANINKETLEAMKSAGQAMKIIHGDLNIDKVDKTMEDLREQHMIGEEINEAIAQSIGNNALDEDELDEELAELQQEELTNRMLDTGSVPVGDKVNKLPSAPQGVKGKAAAEEEDEEEELRKLQAEMAM